ncbi:hypothetical protein [Mycoplasma seminis]|uniref:Uncharacterized protein n=1 Tax=Mycoplasma seminis TaxID=512749 RepID=A0ABY9H989_9MOLU|nr:hypothetical protein [Mycoplasma seminis]WLP85145.1 hypothetical protein Q8852_02355 [Mycoplasma seminis]
MSQVEIFKIPFCTRNHKSSKNTKAIKCKFNLYIAFDTKLGYIKTWYLNFTECQIDKMNTKQHLDADAGLINAKPPRNFKIRKKLFE